MRLVQSGIESLLATMLVWSYIVTCVYGAETTTATTAGTTTTAAVSRATSTAVTSTATSTVATSTAKTPTTTAATTTSTTATFTFRSMPTMTACATQMILWDTAGFDPKQYHMELSVLNLGINQSIPTGNVQATTPGTSTTTSTASLKARAEAPQPHLFSRASEENHTIGSISAVSGYNMTVPVPRGRWYIHGVLNNIEGTWANSMIFTVVEGTNTSCLWTTTTSSTSAAATSTAGSGTGTAAGAGTTSAAATGSNSTSSGSSVKGGAIAGIVIGVLAGLALLGLLLLCLRRRKRNAQTAKDYTTGPATTGVAHSNSRHSLRHVPGSDGGHIALTSFGGVSDEHEKGPYAAAYHPEAQAPATSTVPTAAPVAAAPAAARRTSNPFAGAPTSSPEEHDAYGGISEARNSVAGSFRQSASYPNDTVVAPGAANSGNGASIARSTSTRRKPVPSLGPELRNQLQRQQQDVSAEEPVPMRTRQNFKLMPDPPAR